VLCADDDPGFRGVVRTLIESLPGFRLVGEATSGQDAIATVTTLCPDLLLMDVRMPGMDGIDTARLLLRRDPNMVVVLMSASDLPPPSGITASGPRVIFVRKDHLCTRLLLDLWHGRRTRSGPNWLVLRLG
jgi:CheY-like chemotaxis protein